MKKHFITSDLCNKYDLNNEEIAQILINSFSNEETKNEEEIFIKNQFLACLTTSRPSNWPAPNKPFTTHTIHIDKSKGKELYQKCQKALEEAGFNVVINSEKAIMEVKWNNPKPIADIDSSFKDYYTVYSGQDEQPVKKGSDRERISLFLEKWKDKLQNMELNQSIEINAQEEFPEDPYKPVETLMATLLSEGYEPKINYFSVPPVVCVQTLDKSEIIKPDKKEISLGE